MDTKTIDTPEDMPNLFKQKNKREPSYNDSLEDAAPIKLSELNIFKFLTYF